MKKLLLLTLITIFNLMGDAKQADFYLKNNQEDKGFMMLFDMAGGLDMNAKDAENIAMRYIVSVQPKKAIEFLNKFGDKFDSNYRIQYLHSVALKYNQEYTKAINKFLFILDIKKEIEVDDNSEAELDLYFPKDKRGYSKEAINILKLKDIRDCIDEVDRYIPNDTFEKYYYNVDKNNTIKMPNSLIQVKYLILAQLANIVVKSNNIELFPKILNNLKKKNIKYAEYAFLLYSHPKLQQKYILENNAEKQSIFEYFHKKYPDDKTITSIWFTYTMGKVKTESEFRKMFDLCKKNYPQFIKTMFLNTYIFQHLNIQAEEYIKEMLDIIEKEDETKLFSNYGQFYLSSLQNKIKTPLKTQIGKKLENLISNADNETIYKNFHFLIPLLIENGKYEELIQYIENYQLNKLSIVSNDGKYDYFYNKDLLIKDLNYSEKFLENLPHQFISFLNNDNYEKYLGIKLDNNKL